MNKKGLLGCSIQTLDPKPKDVNPDPTQNEIRQGVRWNSREKLPGLQKRLRSLASFELHGVFGGLHCQELLSTPYVRSHSGLKFRCLSLPSNWG